MVLSPITGKANVLLEEKKSTKEIIAGYKQAFNIDTSDYFNTTPFIEVYRCLDTDYRFYYPFHIAGNGSFYDQLQKQPWYYSEWKWEYQIALETFRSAGRLLEIGCGNGSFLKKMQTNAIHCIGLELSEDAISAGKNQGLDIRKELIEQHAEKNEETYDYVCAFQLLEHISAVHSLLEASLKVLKKGGLILVAVPNNDALFFKYKRNKINHLDHLYQATRLLNLPPHHMGLWNRKSLESLPKVYPLRLENIFTEPMNEHRKLLNQSILTDRMGIAGKVLNKTGATVLLESFFKEDFKYADTIMAIYTKL
ncbi:class I SAM-dependent methyltransferase [Rhodocytophaga rosea]|uniref:Class I SAM-dependent methyltransferase n=1 Tax=Rhodocytophaga rosea TaxID=2704465 RepID=A0A6C0GR45_9BACT|nr:class I SAM-dependent methyltransferase [Rhodocytophaga rosea]QHT70539.1 class I SAM-dependent methyltransferase [Rhodocytophaga rosea]